MIENTLEQRIQQLSTPQRQLLFYKMRQVYVAQQESATNTSQKRLVACVKASEVLVVNVLKQFLKARIPEYMIPSEIISVDTFPMLPNGKIDKKSLSTLMQLTPSESSKSIQKPTNDIETKLVAIWQEVLQLETIGIQDNFFEIGGDSISSIQIIAKARKAGIQLQPNQVFDHQTIAELALFIHPITTPKVLEETIVGEVQLTPIQHWFFEVHTAAPHFWNQIVQISNVDTISYESIAKVIKALVGYHDALRLSFMNHNDRWTAHVLDIQAIQCCFYVDVSTFVTIEEQEQQIKEEITKVQQQCRLEEGGLFRVLYFECGRIQQHKVYLIAHHLGIDMVSWNSIFSDFTIGIQQVQQNTAIQFKPKTNSIRDWGTYLLERSEAPEIIAELPFWEAQRTNTIAFPADFTVANGVLPEHTIVMHQSKFSSADTEALLHKVNEAYITKIEDILITALLSTLCNWAGITQCCMGLERHGRNTTSNVMDVSNTIGWFTAFFPVNLHYAPNEALGTVIKSVKEQLRAIPNDGIGYGILKYLSQPFRNRPSLQQAPQIIFNYLGIQSATFENTDIQFQYSTEGFRDSLSERTYGIEINAFVLDNQLQMNWSYSTALYTEKTLLALVRNFENTVQDLITHCTQKEVREYTPSDFPESGLNQDDLDHLMQNL